MKLFDLKMKRLKQTKWAQLLVTHKRLVVVISFVLLIVLALVSSGGIMKSGDESSERAIFVVEGEEYRQSTVNGLIDFPLSRGLSREEATKEAFELVKKKKTAEKLGIKPTPQEVEVQKQELIKNLKDEEEFTERYNPWFDLLAYTNVVEKYIGTTPNNSYKGYVFDIPFGQHIQYGPAFTPKGLNDPDLIEQDKKYAEEKANYYHEQLRNNAFSPDQVLQELNNDRKLSALKSGNATQSVKFGYDPEVNWRDEIYYQAVSEYIMQSENTGLSDVKIGQASVDSTPENKADMYFYFVLTEKLAESKGVSKQAFEDELAKLNTEYRGF